MLLLVTSQQNNRLQYIAGILLGRLLGIRFRIVSEEDAGATDEPRIYYTSEPLPDIFFQVYRFGLLDQKGIQPLDPAGDCSIMELNGQSLPVFFRSDGFTLPFDIFSASFYLLSRYEEYTEDRQDEYQRYPHHLSLAYRKEFLQIPVINYWAMALGEALARQFPGLSMQKPSFGFIPSYDIDIAWSYLHKGLWRNIGGFLRKPGPERLRVLSGKEADPYDSYRYLQYLHRQYNLRPIYFFLVAFTRTRYDKNIDPRHPAFRALVRDCLAEGQIGLHPSWQSNDYPVCLVREKEFLEGITGKPVTSSRQHYIRFRLPNTYRMLAEAGVEADYSMGYGSINGFRASVATAYPWYDLALEHETSLLIHPFCFMDANSHFEQKETPAEAGSALGEYLYHCRKTGGTLISIFHNQFLGNAREFSGWKTMYESFIAQVRQGELPGA